jgi:hypothetical protein
MPEPTLRPVGITGLLASVPFLLGYAPSESLVVVLLKQTRVVLTMRVALADLAELDVVAKTQLALQRADGDGLMVIGYSHAMDDELAVVLQEFACEVEDGFTARRVRVLDVVQVGAGSWRSLHPATFDQSGDLRQVRDDPINAEAVFRGLSPFPSREAIAARVRPNTNGRDPAFDAALAEAIAGFDAADGEGVGDELAVMLDGCLSTEDQLKPEVLGRLAGLASHPASLKSTLRKITAESATRCIEIWSAASRQSRGAAAFMPLILTGVAAWVSGDGALSNLCADLASDIYPRHLGVRLLGRLSDRCLPPETWEPFRANLGAQVGTAREMGSSA